MLRRITAVYRRKAVASDWFPNDAKLAVKGKIEFFQQTEYDVTNVEVALEGLSETSGYHVHMVCLEFKPPELDFIRIFISDFRGRKS